MTREHAEWVFRAWRYRLRLDRAELRWLLKSVLPGQCVVDIGAHKGGYTYWMSRAVGPKGHVFAFEPQARLAEYLKARCSAAGLAHVTVEQLGASDQEAILSLRVPNIGSSPGATFEQPGNNENDATASVRVVRLDRYFESTPRRPISLIKCDVEGHELKVFRGAKQILLQDRPALLFECEQRHRRSGSTSEVFEYLESLGYRGGFFDRHDLHPLGVFDERLHQAQPGTARYVNNFLFLHANRGH